MREVLVYHRHRGGHDEPRSGNSTTFAVHTRLLGSDRYGLENVANLRQLPARGAQVIVGVIPWEEGSGGPCRLLATY